MKEIKFRAFHKPSKKMFDVTNIDFRHKFVFSFEEIIGYSKHPYFDYVCYPLKDCELMQYTGLKDVEGKEIYEGDIIKNINHNLITKVCWDDQYSGYSLVNKNFVVSLLDYNPSIYYIVIGNIYENKEFGV